LQNAEFLLCVVCRTFCINNSANYIFKIQHSAKYSYPQWLGSWRLVFETSTHNKPFPTGLAAYKQSALDKLISVSERLELTYSLSNIEDEVPLLAVTSANSGNWLHALLLLGCIHRLDDCAVHIAVGFRIGSNICKPHQCPCGVTVDAKGLHGLSCEGGSAQSARQW